MNNEDSDSGVEFMYGENKERRRKIPSPIHVQLL